MEATLTVLQACAKWWWKGRKPMEIGYWGLEEELHKSTPLKRKFQADLEGVFQP